MKRFCAVVFTVAVLGMLANLPVSAADPFSVGETWVYKHAGARTTGQVGMPVNGDRVITVKSTAGEGDAKMWILSEQWGKDDANPIEKHVNAKRLLCKSGPSSQLITLNPPVPYAWTGQKPGEEGTFQIKMGDGEMSIPMTFVSKRMENETLKVPAGEFKDCKKVKTVATMELPGPQNQKMKLEFNITQWYHPSVNGFVKEEFKFTPPSRPSTPSRTFSGVSELKSHTVK